MSELKPYSLGIVAVNKKPSSDTIEVTPTEKVPLISGEITDNVNDFNTNAKDANGAAYSENLQNTVTISAKWLPAGNTNRKTAPDVRRGETVQILQFSDSDKYYWTTLHDWSELRRLETVIYAYSANPDDKEANTNENMYYVEISSHKRLIHLHTSTANKETTEFDIQLNTGEGYLIIQDGFGNKFYLDAKGRELKYINTDGSSISINKKNISIEAPETITMKAKSFIGEFKTMETTAVAKTHNGPYAQKGNFTLTGALGGQMTVGRSGTLFTGDFVINGTFRSNQINCQSITSASNLVIGSYNP
ncbi:MAG: hypothetical protein ACMV1B_02165 [Prevotella sp.]